MTFRSSDLQLDGDLDAMFLQKAVEEKTVKR